VWRIQSFQLYLTTLLFSRLCIARRYAYFPPTGPEDGPHRRRAGPGYPPPTRPGGPPGAAGSRLLTQRELHGVDVAVTTARVVFETLKGVPAVLAVTVGVAQWRGLGLRGGDRTGGGVRAGAQEGVRGEALRAVQTRAFLEPRPDALHQ